MDISCDHQATLEKNNLNGHISDIKYWHLKFLSFPFGWDELLLLLVWKGCWSFSVFEVIPVLYCLKVLTMIITDFNQMFRTSDFWQGTSLVLQAVLFNSFNDFLHKICLIWWHLSYEYSGCGIWALVCGRIWFAGSWIGWKNENSQVSTWLLKDPRFQRSQI